MGPTKSLLIFLLAAGSQLMQVASTEAAAENVLGTSAALTGSAGELGKDMQRGILAGLERANRTGGVNGRSLRLIALDDYYEPARTDPNVRQLIECQMPEMDGYETTQAIRTKEQSSVPGSQGKPPVYIVAITANAMEGDREKCLAAGMDDYLGKPVRFPDLQAVMERWQARRSGDGSEEASKLKSNVRTDNRRKMLAISNSGENS